MKINSVFNSETFKSCILIVHNGNLQTSSVKCIFKMKYNVITF